MKAHYLALCAASMACAVPAEAATKSKPHAQKQAAAESPAVREDMGISAIVNDQAISSYDVANRIRFIIATTNLTDSPEVVERIRPQVVRSLIDESLQTQEATRNNITVDDKEVDQAIVSIEKQRNMPPGAIYDMLSSRNVPRETFISQIRAQLAWNKLLMKKIRPQVSVSDEEIQIASHKSISAPKQAGGRQELQIAVITLPVDKPARENEIRKLGEKLVKEVRSGANFEEVSRQFSSVAANSGGKVESFWVSPEQLDPAVAGALNNARAGMITEPVRTSDGFTIIKVYNTRAAGSSPSDQDDDKGDFEVTLKEILLKLKSSASVKEADILLQIGEEVARHPGTCEEKGIANIQDLDDFDIDVNYRKAMLSQLPGALKIIADNLKVGDISTPFASQEGIRLYMLCGKKQAEAPIPPREQVSGMLLQQKMELEAQKYIRNLRREAFIEIR